MTCGTNTLLVQICQLSWFTPVSSVLPCTLIIVTIYGIVKPIRDHATSMIGQQYEGEDTHCFKVCNPSFVPHPWVQKKVMKCENVPLNLRVTTLLWLVNTSLVAAAKSTHAQTPVLPYIWYVEGLRIEVSCSNTLLSKTDTLWTQLVRIVL